MVKDDRLNIRINSQLKKEFEEYREKMGYTQSGIIERLIREELKKAKKKEIEHFIHEELKKAKKKKAE